MDKNLKSLLAISILFAIWVGVMTIKTQSEIKDLMLASSNQVVDLSGLEYSIIGQASLTINDGKGTSRTVQLAVSQDTTVFDLLKKTGISFDFTEYDMGVFIDAIEGIENNQAESSYWLYYVNGEQPSVGVSAQLVEPGDEIEFKFEKISW